MNLALIMEEVYRQPWGMMIPSLDAMLARLEDGAEFTEEDRAKFHALSLEQRESVSDLFGRPIEGRHYASISKGVGYLMIDGPIVPKANAFSDVSGMVSMDVLTSDFKALQADPQVETIVQLFDTPGGTIRGVDEYSALVHASKKPVHSFILGMAGSAGYLMASAAKTISTPAFATVGSIGVIVTLRDTRKADAKKGVENISVASEQSPNKNPDITTEEGKGVYRKIATDLAAEFVASVATYRGVSEEHVLAEFGGGAMLAARPALAAGMIDKISTTEEFVASLASAGGAFFITSAEAETTHKAEDTSMAVEAKNSKVTTVEELQAQSPEIHAAIVATAQAEETARLKAFEEIKAGFDNDHPAVKKAVAEAVNSFKWTPGATAEGSMFKILGVAKAARNAVVADVAEPRHKAAEIVKKIGGPAAPAAKGEKDPEALDQNQVNGMLAAAKAEGRIK